MQLSTRFAIPLVVCLALQIARAQSATPAPPTARQSASLPEFQRSVALWSDLASLDGTLRHRSVFVQEERRAGDVVFIETADLPAWATGTDIHGLSITDASGTGKWIHRWKGPVDFSRLDFDYDQNPTEERAALDQLIQAGFDDIFLPAGDYDGYFNRTIDAPLTLRGAGPDKTILHGDRIGGHTLFHLNSDLTLEDLKVTDTTRLAFINPSSQQSLGTIALTLRDCAFEVDDAIGGTNSAVIQSFPTEPLPGTFFRLQMKGCTFRVAPEMDHISARSGLAGSIDSCTFEGGKRVLSNIPTSDSGHFPGQPANDFSVGFRVTNCEFGQLTYTGGSDAYHLQVAGRDWSVSNCTFDEAGAFGATESGHIYSNLQDSRIVGCTFIGGGAYHLFCKGGERANPSTTVVDGNGWGNVIMGCSFEGSSSVPSFAQIFMNVKEQRFLDCTFRNYSAYAISANQQAQSSDNLLIDACSFSTDASSSAIRFLNGGQNIRILNSTFADIVGPPNARQGLIVFEAYPLVNSDRFDDLRIEGCSFLDCDYPALYFYPSGRTYTVSRMRFLKNVLRLPTGGAFLGGGSATIEDLVLADNFIDVDGNFAWQGMPSDCIARSTNNVWVDNGGIFPPDDDARGIRTGTRFSVQAMLAGGATVAVSDDMRAVRVAGAAGAVTSALADGHFDGQELVLIGASDVDPVTFQDLANLDLAANRTLGLRDTLRVIWDASTMTWAELDFSDN